MEKYISPDGVDCVYIVYPDGSTWSGLKSAYDAQQAQAEHFTPIVLNEAKTI